MSNPRQQGGHRKLNAIAPSGPKDRLTWFAALPLRRLEVASLGPGAANRSGTLFKLAMSLGVSPSELFNGLSWEPPQNRLQRGHDRSSGETGQMMGARKSRCASSCRTCTA